MPNQIKSNEQLTLLPADRLFPEQLPTIDKLKPSYSLLAVFNECHNYIYANEGLLKEKIFHEMVKLLVMKLHDEQSSEGGRLQFGITAHEYKCLLANEPSSFNDRINCLFETIKDKYKNLITDNKLKLKTLTLANAIGRLQHISLMNTTGDIKGEAFQSFAYHKRLVIELCLIQKGLYFPNSNEFIKDKK